MKPSLNILVCLLAVIAIIDCGSGLKCFSCKDCWKVSKSNADQVKTCKGGERCLTVNHHLPFWIERSCSTQANAGGPGTCSTWTHPNGAGGKNCFCIKDFCNDEEFPIPPPNPTPNPYPGGYAHTSSGPSFKPFLIIYASVIIHILFK